jgi:hypothetical protein
MRDLGARWKKKKEEEKVKGKKVNFRVTRKFIFEKTKR